MILSKQERRDFLKLSAIVAGGLVLPDPVQASAPPAALNVVCVGGHPDDPETGCGGTLALLSKQGHNVTIIYLTTGEAGIQGTSHADAATIRKQESLNACKVLNAKAVFAGQIDGATIVNNEWVQKIFALVEHEKPSLVFTHWPIDSHKDHQAASLLTIQAWQMSQKKYPLYFFEVEYGIQTTTFNPTDYVNITSTQEQKRKSVYCHTSQDPPGIYASSHGEMEKFRGMAIGVKAAEAFIKADGAPAISSFFSS